MLDRLDRDQVQPRIAQRGAQRLTLAGGQGVIAGLEPKDAALDDGAGRAGGKADGAPALGGERRAGEQAEGEAGKDCAVFLGCVACYHITAATF